MLALPCPPDRSEAMHIGLHSKRGYGCSTAPSLIQKSKATGERSSAANSVVENIAARRGLL